MPRDGYGVVLSTGLQVANERLVAPSEHVAHHAYAAPLEERERLDKVLVSLPRPDLADDSDVERSPGAAVYSGRTEHLIGDVEPVGDDSDVRKPEPSELARDVPRHGDARLNAPTDEREDERPGPPLRRHLVDVVARRAPLGAAHR